MSPPIFVVRKLGELWTVEKRNPGGTAYFGRFQDRASAARLADRLRNNIDLDDNEALDPLVLEGPSIRHH